jgi:hypothetical protein
MSLLTVTRDRSRIYLCRANQLNANSRTHFYYTHSGPWTKGIFLPRSVFRGVVVFGAIVLIKTYQCDKILSEIYLSFCAR